MANYILVEKKSSTPTGKPTKNALKDMQRHNKTYNKKHPHSLAPMLKKDAGNVELNNDRFNKSVDYSRLSGGAESSADVSASGAGDAGAACGEALTVEQAWQILDESGEDLTEASLKDIAQKLGKTAKNVASTAKTVASVAKDKVVDAAKKVVNGAKAPINGIAYYNDKNVITRIEELAQSAVKNDQENLRKRMFQTIKIQKGYAMLYQDGVPIFDTRNGGSDMPTQVLVVEYQSNADGQVAEVGRYNGIKYHSSKGSFVGNKSKYLDLTKDTQLPTKKPDTFQDICANIYLYAQDKSDAAKGVTYSYKVLDGNKLILDTADLKRTAMGKLIANISKIKQAQNKKQQKQDNKDNDNSDLKQYNWVLIKVGESKSGKPTYVIDNFGGFESKLPITAKTKLKQISDLQGVTEVAQGSGNAYTCEVYNTVTKVPVVVYELGKAIVNPRFIEGALQSGHLSYAGNGKFSNGKKSYTMGAKEKAQSDDSNNNASSSSDNNKNASGAKSDTDTAISDKLKNLTQEQKDKLLQYMSKLK